MDIAYFSHQHSFGIKVALELKFCVEIQTKEQ